MIHGNVQLADGLDRGRGDGVCGEMNGSDVPSYLVHRARQRVPRLSPHDPDIRPPYALAYSPLNTTTHAHSCPSMQMQSREVKWRRRKKRRKKMMRKKK
jgi:hypothetical protein